MHIRPLDLLSPGVASVGRVRECSAPDKYAWFSFAYTCDLLLGPLPLFPTEAHRQFQLDRIDTIRHYTIDNVRWLSKSDNIANKPPGRSPYIQDAHFSKTDLVRIMYSIERTQLQLIQLMSIQSDRTTRK
jgi:hypothetical protein